MMRTLFNRHVTHMQSVSAKEVVVPQVLQLVSFHEREPILLFSPELSSTGDTQVYALRYDLSTVDRSKMSAISAGKPVRIYSRFRYDIDVKNTPGIERPSWPRNSSTYIDIRVNEPRTSEIDGADVLRQLECHVFVVAPTRYRLSDFGTRLRHVRLLEKEIWNSYATKRFSKRQEYLVYKWKEEYPEAKQRGADRFYLCILLSSERTDLKNLLLAAIGLLLVLVAGCLEQKLGVLLYLFVNWLNLVRGSVIAAMLSICVFFADDLKNLLWRFLKLGARKMAVGRKQ